ncbi:MAG: AI-2E family transporter [Salinibacterium sp.]|nr:AI-2E family transporter [Salinibacterium sp.]
MDSPRPLWTDSLGRLGIRSAQILLVLIIAGLVVYASVQLKIIVIPVFVALILASALYPLVRWLVNHRVPRPLATVGTLLAGVAVLGGIITLVVTGVRSEWANLSDAVTQSIDKIQEFLESGTLPVDSEQIAEARNAVVDFLTSAEFGSTALAGAGTVVELITGVVLTVVLLFFFLQDGPHMWEFLLRPLRPSRQLRARRVGDRATGVLGGYVRGTALVALVDTIFIGLALWILQVPLALPLALLVFVGAFIPIVGATVAGTVAALVALVTNDLLTAIIVAAVVILVNQLEGNLLAPVVLGNALKLHALVVLLALSAGTILGGIIGTFLAVPLAAVAWAAIKAWNDPAASRLEPVTSARPRR